ncbi:putative RING finger protein [Lachnellula hyalina]|uniref:Putative RING finger protein n=1 Tax=Lachnellula hyalina TaxID=1316788 RepID=A0A8H8R8U4_9HELO|nr:putative RING finger protein [Lachnellula hyalina]TVY29701.1 putative RING finger protein [Lachnellula hyalina]
MTSLVSDFLINPVLRQARRFSRSTSSGDHIDPVTNQRTPLEIRHEVAVEDIAGHLEELRGPGIEGDGVTESLSGAILTSSPIEEDGGLDAELQAQEANGANGPPSFESAYISPLLVSSIRSNTDPVDDDVSDNPSFGVPSRFRTDSATSATFSTNHTVVDSTMSPAEGPSRRSTQELRQGSSHQRNSSLPADDGMGALRQQIISIQAMDVPNEEKARHMHKLLTRGYSRAQEFHIKLQPQATAPEEMISQERPATPGSLSSFIWQMNGAPESGLANHQHTFHLSPEDLRPTFYEPLFIPELDADGESQIEDGIPVLGCPHYKRNVKLQCSTCDRWYTCRLCHDKVEDHILIRKATKNMLCMLCGCAQGAGEVCVECGERTAWYYCGVCKLWDNDSSKSIYHCNDCGICRKGRGLGKDFFHCKTCGVCMSMSVEHSHKCIERVSDCDCPICGEYMFTSPSPVVFMLCGHSIHKACYDEHMKSSYKCPICSKSTVNMESQFRNLDRAIDSQPMPPQFQDTKAMVSCNDCYAKSAVKYHWLGLKCAICDSYNTAQLSILSDPAIEVPPIENRELELVSPPDLGNGEIASSGYLGVGPPRTRRHSYHVQPPIPIEGSNRFSPYSALQRLGRSVSPIRGIGLFGEPAGAMAIETDDSAEEDELDFWGRDEPRSVTSGENIDEVEEDAESDDDSAMDDCDDDGEDGDDEDQFEIFGHR